MLCAQAAMAKGLISTWNCLKYWHHIKKYDVECPTYKLKWRSSAILQNSTPCIFSTIGWGRDDDIDCHKCKLNYWISIKLLDKYKRCMNSPFFLNIASTRLVVSLPLARRVAKSYPPLLIRLLHWNAGRDKRSVNTHSRNGKRHPTIAQPSLSQWFHAAPQGQGHAETRCLLRPVTTEMFYK